MPQIAVQTMAEPLAVESIERRIRDTGYEELTRKSYCSVYVLWDWMTYCTYSKVLHINYESQFKFGWDVLIFQNSNVSILWKVTLHIVIQCV